MASSKLELPGGLKVVNPYPADAKYFNTSDVPYTDTAQVLSQLPTGSRHLGLTVNVAGVEYWWESGLGDGDLIVKTSGGTLTDGNGTTANGTAADLGGVVNVDTYIDIDSSVTEFFIGSLTNGTGLYLTPTSSALVASTSAISLTDNGDLLVNDTRGSSKGLEYQSNPNSPTVNTLLSQSLANTIYVGLSGNQTINGNKNFTGQNTHTDVNWFEDLDLRIFNPAKTFEYRLRTSAILSNISIFLPLISSNNTLTVGSTGSVENAILRANGTGGSTIQSSSILLSDTGDLTLGISSVTANTRRSILAEGSSPDIELYLESKGNGFMTLSSLLGLNIIDPTNSYGTFIGLGSGSTDPFIQSGRGITGNFSVLSREGEIGLPDGGDIIISPGNGYSSGNGDGGSLFLNPGTGAGTGGDGNIGILTETGSFGGGEKVIFIHNATTVPSSNPTNGGILFVEGGALKFRGSSGTISTIAPA